MEEVSPAYFDDFYKQFSGSNHGNTGICHVVSLVGSFLHETVSRSDDCTVQYCRCVVCKQSEKWSYNSITNVLATNRGVNLEINAKTNKR